MVQTIRILIFNMNIHNEFFGLLQEQNILKTTKTKPLVDAIQNRHPISFMYIGPRKGKERVKAGKRVKVEAVALGLSKKGNLIIRGYTQAPSATKTGFDKHGWRTFMVSRMNSIQVFSNETFESKRPGYQDGAESKAGPMQVTYVTSDWDKKPEEPKVKKTIKKEPTIQPQQIKPEVPPTVDVPVNKPEVPPVDQNNKPDPVAKQNPPVNQRQPEPAPTDLPQIKPEEKPSLDPEDDIEKNLKEEMKRIKSLILY